MNYEEYQTIKSELESQLKKLEEDYLTEHSIPIGTPVILLGKNDGWSNNKGLGKLHHVAQIKISLNGDIDHNILPAKKDGTAAKGGGFTYFCSKKDLQVVTNDDH
jgi:hypothetical protein